MIIKIHRTGKCYLLKRVILNLFLVITVACTLSQQCFSRSFTSKYDFYINKYAKQYLPEYVSVYGKEVFKAQLFQESLLNPNAVSPAGAVGIGQIMPKTFLDLKKQLRFPSHITAFSAKENIEASAFYLSSLLREWSAPRPLSDKLSLGWASYNAGLGHILDAQKLCDNKPYYRDIIKCLHKVTGRHSKETITYVERIWSYYFQMRFL